MNSTHILKNLSKYLLSSIAQKNDASIKAIQKTISTAVIIV